MTAIGTGRTLTLTPNAALDIWTTTPRITPGPKLRCTPPDEDPGGGGINVSRVIHRLGGDTLALFVAGGRAGDAVADALARDGVPAVRIAMAGTTRQSFSVREDATGEVFRFVTPGPDLQISEAQALLDRLDDCAAGAALVVGSGSLPPGAPDDFWAQAAARTRAAGARFVLDTGVGAVAALRAGVFVFRENADVIARVAGRALAWPDQVADWASARVHDGSAEMIIATEGAQGALLVTADRRIILSPPHVTVQSAIGAGDSFVGGFCHGLTTGHSPEDALRLGVATAAATMLTPGTALCRKEDALRLMDECGEARTV